MFITTFQVIRFDGGEQPFISGEFNFLRKVMPLRDCDVVLAAGMLIFKSIRELH